MEALQHKAECTDCGRRILITLVSIGTPHQWVDHIICAKCLVSKGIDKEWAKDNPEEAKELEAWIQDSEQNEAEG